MRLRGKLGNLSAGQLVGLLLAFASIIVCVLFIREAGKAADPTAEAVCAVEVQQAAMKNAFYGREYAMDIKACQTKQVTIKGSALPADSVKAEERVKHVIAEEMRTCWKQWGSGDVDLFNKEGTYCATCTVVTLDEDAQKKVPVIHDFTKYLYTQKALTGKTYWETLQGGEASVTQVPSGDMKTDENVAVLFSYARVQNGKSLLQMLTGDETGPTEVMGVFGFGFFYAAGGAMLFAATLASAPVSIPLLITGTAGATALGYVGSRATDDWYTVSATYLTPQTVESYYYKECTNAASITQSP